NERAFDHVLWPQQWIRHRCRAVLERGRQIAVIRLAAERRLERRSRLRGQLLLQERAWGGRASAARGHNNSLPIHDRGPTIERYGIGSVREARDLHGCGKGLVLLHPVTDPCLVGWRRRHVGYEVTCMRLEHASLELCAVGCDVLCRSHGSHEGHKE